MNIKASSKYYSDISPSYVTQNKRKIMTQEVCVYILGRRNIREARTVALSLHMSKYHMVNFSPYLQHGGTLQERSKFLYPANMHSNMAVQWKECHDVEPHKLLNFYEQACLYL